MCHRYIILVFACTLSISTAQWTCQLDSDCTELSGSVCQNGQCLCPAGQMPGLGGDSCVDATSYHASPCFTHTQCARLFTGFECKRENGSIEGTCECLLSHHYFQGRCWSTTDFGQPCTRDEQCITEPKDPFALACNTVCDCAQGYYLRQRGECRQIASAVGDGCVIDEDCQFPNGVCDIESLTCIVNNAEASSSNVRGPTTFANASTVASSLDVLTSGLRQQGLTCEQECPETFACINGACICPVGYYLSEDRSICYADLGSPSTPAQCVGLLAEVIDGICRCPANFFYERNMRDCIRVTRVISQSCVTDSNCQTFGSAARCGAPQEDLWGVRSCECDSALSVWDANRSMCRLFVGLGEACEVNSDCLAGEFEAECVTNNEEQGYCACPEGLTESDGLCLTTGLGLGDACQANSECTEIENTVCRDTQCACANGYRETDGYCEPIIGGECIQNTDCAIENTVCVTEANTTISTCQCNETFVPHDDLDYCWPVAQGYESSCNVTSQCASVLGENSLCANGVCICEDLYHHRDGYCWPQTGLFESCARTSECFLSERSERVVCRNSQCLCDFDHPYSEQLNTCVSSASHVMASASLLFISFLYIVL